MKQRPVIFEISCIAILLLLGMALSVVSVDNTGILSVAGLLSLFFVTSHHKALLRILAIGPISAWSATPTSNTGES